MTSYSKLQRHSTRYSKAEIEVGSAILADVSVASLSLAGAHSTMGSTGRLFGIVVVYGDSGTI